MLRTQARAVRRLLAYRLNSSCQEAARSEWLDIVGMCTSNPEPSFTIPDPNSRTVQILCEYVDVNLQACMWWGPVSLLLEGVSRRLHRCSLAVSASRPASVCWVTEGEHVLWRGVSDPYKHTIRAFLVHFHSAILRHSTERFSFLNGSVGALC